MYWSSNKAITTNTKYTVVDTSWLLPTVSENAELHYSESLYYFEGGEDMRLQKTTIMLSES